MACSYTIRVEPYGVIEVLESVRCRKVILRVTKDGRIRVSAPRGLACERIVNYINEQRAAIDKYVATCLSRCHKVIFSPDTKFSTRSHVLEMSATSTDGFLHLRVTKSLISVTYPPELSHENEQVQRMVRKAIDAALRMEARMLLPGRVEYWAQKFGLKYDRVDFRNMTSQWGSCSSTGRICLNIQLMRLPDELVDMVILHELNHTRHMDHSPAFYADLDVMCGGRVKELNAEMKKWSPVY